MFLLGMTNSIGGFEQIAPDAKLGDGKFSLIVVKTANWSEMIRLVGLVLNGGKHIDDDQIIYTKTNKLSVSSPTGEEISINLDGELGGKTPVQFTNLKHHLKMFANVDSIPHRSIEKDSIITEYLAQIDDVQKEDLSDQKE